MSAVSSFVRDTLDNVDIRARVNAKQIAGVFVNQAGIQSFGEIAYVKKAKADLEDGECLVSNEVAIVENGNIRPVGENETPNAIVVCSARGLANFIQQGTSDNVNFQVYNDSEEVYYIALGEGYNNEGNGVFVKVYEDVAKDQLLKPNSNGFTYEIADTTDDVALLQASNDAKAGEVVFAKRFFKVVE